jgi:PAS domain S-box-containing protein
MVSALFSVPTLAQQIESLQPGDHVCVVSDSSSASLALLVPFVRRCLARKEMCLYAIGERSAEDVVAELIQAGVDVEQAREKGALTLLSSREFMPLAEFDPSAFISLLRSRAQRALKAGFCSASFAVEMIWGLALGVAHDALIQVEARLNTELFSNVPAIGLCIYDRQLLPAEYLRVALRSHPLAIIDDKLISDPFYEPPELVAQPSEAASVDWMITQLIHLADDREQLRHSHDRLRALVENASDGISVLDADGSILYAAPSVEQLMGYKPEEVVEHHAKDFMMSQGDVAPLMDSIRRALENPGEIQTLRVRGRRKDGSPIEIEAAGQRLRDMADPQCVVFNWRDITERVQFYDGQRQRLELENTYLQEEVRAVSGSGLALGTSAGIRRVLEQIEMVSPTDANVLIVGETGVGKELVARAIHESSRRFDRPLVKINCTAIPRELFESEFFGHVKGSFSGALRDRTGRFQLADGGTLFLDEIGDLPIEMQPKLLQVLEEGRFEPVGSDATQHVNVRILVASNRDLRSLIRAGRFREDLYYRLSTFPIAVPPLRERKNDIPALAAYFLDEAYRRFDRPRLKLSEGHIDQLCNYEWPGNIRELRNVVERAVITARSGSIHFEVPVLESGSEVKQLAAREPNRVIRDKELKLRERENIVAALKQARGRVYGRNGAARLLGIKASTLSARIRKFGIERIAVNPQEPLSHAVCRDTFEADRN